MRVVYVHQHATASRRMEGGERVGMEGGEHPVGMESGERFNGYGASAINQMLNMVSQALASYRSLPQAGQSLFMWNAALQVGKFVTVSSNGGYVDPTTASIDQSTGIVSANGSTWGYAVAVVDPPKHGVASLVQHVEDVGSDIGDALSGAVDFLGSLPGAIAGGAAALVKLIVQGIEAVGADLDALLSFGDWVLDFLGQIVALLDPTGTSASRSAAFAKLSPTRPGGAIYALFTNPKYEKGLALGLLIVALPAVLLFDAVGRPVLSRISPKFAEILSPTHFVDIAVQMVSLFLQGLAAHRSVFDIVQDLVEAYLYQVGIVVSPACVVKIVYACITGPFFPPLPAIAVMIASDPVFQKSADQTLGTNGTLEKLLPVAMSCFNAADASSWLSCFEGILDALFPGILTGLSNLGVSAHDLRVLVQAIWESGGDFSLVLSEAHFPGVTDAVMGVGFYGVGWVANAVNGVTHAFNGYGALGAVDFAAVEAFFLSVVVPNLDASKQEEVSHAFDIFNLAMQVLHDGGTIGAGLSFDRQPTGWALYLLRRFNEARWDVEVAISAIVADEFDPHAPHFFSANAGTQLGKRTYTPALLALWAKVKADFPRLHYQLIAVESALGLSEPVAPPSTTVVSSKPAQLPASTGGSASHALAIAVSGGQPSGHVLQSGGGGQGVAAGSKPTTAAKTGINWAMVLGTAATGYLVAKTPGALVGAAAGVFFPGNVPAQTIPGLPGGKS